ncbi:MAG: hypothetical protein AB8B74_00170 [Crocinitomicaceae bacterium]
MKFSGIILLLAALLTFSFSSNIQSDSDDCNTYFPISVGMQWTMESKDKKGKLVGSSTIKVLDAKPAEGGLKYVMQGLFAAEGKEDETHETNFEYQCVNDVLKFNMDNLLPAEMMENKSMSFTMESDGMEIPNNLGAGQKLNDAKMHVVGMIETMKVIDMTMVVSDRKVEILEDVTTKAGTFSCAKITSKTNINMGFINQTTSSIQWISKKVGVVKTEEYDKKGKFDGSTELVEFKR